MTNPIDAAIAAAKLKAAAATEEAQRLQQGTAIVNSPGTAIAVPTKLSMETMAVGGMSVDQWVKVKEDGLKLGDKPGLIESMLVDILMVDGSGFVVKYSAKAGNPAQYESSYDGVTSASGGAWAAALARLQALEPNKAVRPYKSVDLPMTLAEDIKKGDVVLAKVGDVLGYTTSTTNWGNWEVLYRDVTAAGLMGKSVRVKLTAQARTNKNANAWGVVKFDLQGETPEEE